MDRQITAQREDELTGTVETDLGLIGSRPLASPKFVKQKDVEAEVARVKGEDVDARRK